MLSIFFRVLVFDTFKHVWMASHFSKLHKYVMKAAFLTGKVRQIQTFQQRYVKLMLKSCEAHADIYLYLGWQFCSPFLLSSTKHEGFQDAMEYLDYKELRLVLDHFSFFSLLNSGIKVEPALEVVPVIEYLGHHEIQQTPQLHNVIL